MAQHNDTGKRGEAKAIEYFIKLGYEILYTNWKYKRWEIDIIASKNGLLHFIEVKTRTSLKYGYPEENVSKTKIQNLINAAEQFVYLYPKWERIQIDVLAIVLSQTEEPSYFYIEDLYE